jgi:hypothetical protein
MSCCDSQPSDRAQEVNQEKLIFEYQTPPPQTPRIWGMGRGVWLFISLLCGLALGHLDARGDVLLMLACGTAGSVAFVNAIRLLLRMK